MPIHVLPTALSNQIAAGEVVERPASVLKELMENSLDAGAGDIRVEMRGGGAELLRVLDDGEGMRADELALALSRHATSKIVALGDLQHLATMGFRGEALPSIASVARLTLASRAAGEELGFEVHCEGSAQVSAPIPVAHPPGTTVEVRDLFFNTPARRKFLRATRTEQRHAEDVFRRLALGYPGIGMALRCDGTTTLQLPAAHDAKSALRRIGRVFGRSFPAAAIEVDVQTDGLRISGWVGAPGHDRAQSNWQYLYVNGRNVRDSLLRHAMRMAYQEVLPSGRYAVFVLNLEIDPSAVDVNVHPTKHELRFREARLVHDFVFRAIERCLRPQPLFGEAELLPAPVDGPGSRDDGLFARAWTSVGHAEQRAEPDHSLGRAVAERPDLGMAIADAPRAGRTAYGVQARLSNSAGGFAGEVLALVDGRILVARHLGQLLLVDLLAARSAGARARYQVQLQAGEVVSRPLLLPAVLQLREPQADALEAWQPGLAAAGFECRRIGPEEVSIRAIPAAFAYLDAGVLVDSMRVYLGEPGTAGCEDGQCQRVGEAVAAVSGCLEATESLPVGGEALDQLLGELLNQLGLTRIEQEFARTLTGAELLEVIAGASPS